MNTLQIISNYWGTFHTAVCKTVDTYMYGGCQVVQFYCPPPKNILIEGISMEINSLENCGVLKPKRFDSGTYPLPKL